MCVSIQRQYTWLAIYIFLLQIYHGDLSARNILIAEGFLLKIADFGLARELNDQEYYRRQTEVRKSWCNKWTNAFVYDVVHSV